MPFTVPKLRDLLLHYGILHCMQIHEQYPDLTNPHVRYSVQNSGQLLIVELRMVRSG